MTLSRRAMISQAAAAVTAVTALPAYAQFNLGNLIQGAANVASSLAGGEADEIKMGETYYQDYLAKSGGTFPDRNAQEALRRFAQPLLAAADRRALPWEITLVNNKQVNAWALPGGKLAINSELVRQCAQPDELAAVIAHEVGHADKGHSLSQIQNQNLITGLGGIGKEALASLTGSGALGREVLTALEGPLYSMILNGYSRTHEFEADAHILEIFQRTGHDPDKADDFFRTLMRIYPQSSAETTSLFSTHPGTQERISRIEAAAAKLDRPARNAGNPGWAQLKEILPTPKS